MSPLSGPEARRRARAYASAKNLSVDQALREQARLDGAKYDVFLSQAIKDKEIVLGVYAILTEDLGLSVFCDWMEGSASDHASTKPEDADYLRKKLRASTGLVFIDSENAEQSTWMSWEIGWFDAANGRIGAMFDIVRRADNDGDATAAAAFAPEPVETGSIHHQVSVRAQILDQLIPRWRPAVGAETVGGGAAMQSDPPACFCHLPQRGHHRLPTESV